jgi:DNA-binding transcriptional ArsR family regulator
VHQVGYIIERAAQVRALRSPARQEVVDALESAGPSSAAELARLLGKAPDGLYFHLKALVKVGLVEEREQRKNGRHVAAVYDLPARPLRLGYEKPVKRSDVVGVVKGALRLSLRDFERGLAAGAETTPGKRVLWGGRAKGWLSPQEVERVNELLSEVQAIVRQGRPREGARAVSLGFVLAPVQKSKRAKKEVGE